MRPCPFCGREDLDILVPSQTVAREMELRRHFCRDRIDGGIDPAMQKDAIDVAHHAEAEIAICRDWRDSRPPRTATSIPAYGR